MVEFTCSSFEINVQQGATFIPFFGTRIETRFFCLKFFYEADQILLVFGPAESVKLLTRQVILIFFRPMSIIRWYVR